VVSPKQYLIRFLRDVALLPSGKKRDFMLKVIKSDEI
jgi:hypothetical protein